MTARSIALFALAALAEIGGAYLVWLGIKEHKGVAFVALGAMALTAYGVDRGLPAQQRVRPRAGRVRRRVHHRLAAVGHGFDGFQPDRFDVIGALVCLTGVGIIMYSR